MPKFTYRTDIKLRCPDSWLIKDEVDYLNALPSFLQIKLLEVYSNVPGKAQSSITTAGISRAYRSNLAHVGDLPTGMSGAQLPGSSD